MRNKSIQIKRKIITRISGRVEKEIPDTGFFRDFSENIGNLSLKDFFGKDIALFIQRDAKRDGYAYFGVAVQHPTMGIDAYSYLMSGKRKEILDFIAGEDGLNRIQSAAAQLSESLKNR